MNGIKTEFGPLMLIFLKGSEGEQPPKDVQTLSMGDERILGAVEVGIGKIVKDESGKIISAVGLTSMIDGMDVSVGVMAAAHEADY